MSTHEQSMQACHPQDCTTIASTTLLIKCADAGAEKGVAEQSVRDEEFVNSLNARISSMGSVRDSIEEEEPPLALDSFEDASDQELARRFNSRLEEVAPTAQQPQEILTGTAPPASHIRKEPNGFRLDGSRMFAASLPA